MANGNSLSCCARHSAGKALIGGLILLVLLVPSLAGAQAPAPLVPEQPPRPSQPPPAQADVSAAQAGALNLSGLKAVLLVGAIDGDYGDWTQQEKQNMDLAAAELQANGVTVYKFYTPNTDWGQIKTAAQGAHFLLYRGHGIYWGAMPTPPVGGFMLRDQQFISPDDIRADLELAPNAIVMLYGCFTAGSSSNDPEPISSAEAQRRVAQYSDPFFDVGAAGYFANWYGNAFQWFVRYLFQGQTLAQAYQSYFDYNPDTVESYVLPGHDDMVMWLDKDSGSQGTEYNNAFAGLPDETLEGLFAPTAMRVSPQQVLYLAEDGFPAHSYSVLVTSTTATTFTWTASAAPQSWVSFSPQAGNSGQSFSVVITPTGKTAGDYQTTFSLAATPAVSQTVQNDQQAITVTLRVLDQVYRASLPAITTE